MDADPAAPRATRRVALALGLCLLAVIFAVEAKTAWFGPSNGPGLDVSAAKARPADLPQVIDDGVPVPHSLPPLLSVAMLAALRSGRLAASLQSRQLEQGLQRAVRATLLSPQLYFRPPPSISSGRILTA